MKKRIIFVFTMIVAMLLTSFPQLSAEAAAKVKLNKSKAIIEVDGRVYLNLENAKKTVKWSTSDKTVAKVSAKGTVVAVAEGNAKITAKCDGKSYVCRVTVIDSNKEVCESNSNEDIEVITEYIFSDEWSWYTYHFSVIKNNTDETLRVNSSSIAYDKKNKMVGAADATFNALGAGCVSVIYEAFDTDSKVQECDTEIASKKERSYDSVIQDLSYVQNDIEDGAIFQVVNTGDEPAKYVQGIVLFFLDGELVDFATQYFTDDEYEIKPGDVITEQVTTTKDFDEIEIYFQGRS